MGRFANTTKEVLHISEGLLANITDLTLFLVFFGLEYGTSLSSKKEGTYKGLQSANQTLGKINYQSIKRVLSKLKRQGLLKYAKKEFITSDKITNEGLLKIKNLIPVYNSKRTWDGRIYLISYDIPEKPMGNRDRLRNFLKQLKCGYIQQSVWLTCFNPKKLIEVFIKQHHILGQILISDLGPDGSIGDKDLTTLLEEVYNLPKLNFDYKAYIDRFRKLNYKKQNNCLTANFAFLSILQNDPQLPWPLLPDDWVGDKAYRVWQKFLTPHLKNKLII